MKNEILKIFNSENNYSRLGRAFIQKYSYLFNKKDYLAKLKKVLMRRDEKNKRDDFNSNDDIFNSSSKFIKNIFDINYENNHDKIIEKQMKKYLEHKNNYKFHSFHVESNSNSKKFNEEICKLKFSSTLDTYNDNSLINKNKYFLSFDKMNGRDDIKSNKNNDNIINTKNIKIKKIDIASLKKTYSNNYNNLIKPKDEEKNNQTLNKNELFHRKSIKTLLEQNNFHSIQSISNLTTIENSKISRPKVIKNLKLATKKIHANNNLKKRINSYIHEKNFSSLDNSAHIRSINFNKMLSRKENQNKKLKEIDNVYIPINPRYDSIYPKSIINIIYKEKIPRKEFHSKYRKYDNEFILDLDKVYNKYNNHREIQSFSFDKFTGRKKLFEPNKNEEFNEEKESLSGKKISNKKLNDNITDNLDLYKKENLNSNNKSKYGYNTKDDLLENIYKKIIKNLLNKEKKTMEEARLNRIVAGSNINKSYKKLLNIFIKYPFMNDINSVDFS